VFSSEFEPFGDAGFAVEETVEANELCLSDLIGFASEQGEAALERALGRQVADGADLLAVAALFSTITSRPS
jgi:hypothetical protein